MVILYQDVGQLCGKQLSIVYGSCPARVAGKPNRQIRQHQRRATLWDVFGSWTAWRLSNLFIYFFAYLLVSVLLKVHVLLRFVFCKKKLNGELLCTSFVLPSLDILVNLLRPSSFIYATSDKMLPSKKRARDRQEGREGWRHISESIIVCLIAWMSTSTSGISRL